MKTNKIDFYLKLSTLIIFLISIALIPFAIKVKPMNSLESNAIHNDPAYLALKNIQTDFGISEESIAIAIDSETDFFQKQNLMYLKNFSAKLAEIPKVARVIDITNLDDIKITEDEIQISRLVPKDLEITPAIQKSLTNHPLYNTLFLSKDGKKTLIMLTLNPIGKDQLIRDEIIQKIYATIDEFREPNKTIYYTGTTLLMHETNSRILNDNFIVMPIIITILMVLLYLFYRRKWFVVLPFLVAAISVLWVIGIMGIFKIHLTGFTTLVPLVLFTICLCDTVHILNAVWKEWLQNQNQKSKKDIIVRALKNVFWPCFLTSITTAIGFFSLASGQIHALVEMGILIGIGCLVAFILSIVIVLFCIDKIDLRKNMKIEKVFFCFSNLMKKIGKLVVRKPKTLLLTSLCLSFVMALGIYKIQTGQYVWAMFTGETIFEKTNAFFKNQKMGASGELITIFTGKPNTFKDPNVLREIQKIELQLNQHERVVKTFSLLDMIAIAAGKYESFLKGIPLTNTDIKVGLSLLSLSGENFFAKSQYITEDASKLKLGHFIVFGDDSNQVLQFEKDFKKIIHKFLPKDVTYTLTGRPFVWAHFIHYVIDSQAASALLAFIVITIILSFFFKSLKVGLLSLIPNSIPIILILGLIGWFGYLLDAFIAMFACIALGIVVDDTIHFTSHFLNLRKKNIPADKAIIQTFEFIGFPMLITSVLLFFGFSSFILCSLLTSRHFGLSTALACIFALLADYFILPPILFLISRKSSSKLNASQKAQ